MIVEVHGKKCVNISLHCFVISESYSGDTFKQESVGEMSITIQPTDFPPIHIAY